MRDHNIKSISGIILSTVIMINSMLTGCSLSGQRPLDVQSDEASQESSTSYYDDHATVHIATWYDDSYTPYLRSFLSEKFPNYTIEFEYISRDSYEAIIDSQLANKAAPDIICVNAQMCTKEARNKNLEPLDRQRSRFDEIAKKAFSYDGCFYAIPGTSSYDCIYYDVDIMEEVLKEMGEDESLTSDESFLIICEKVAKNKGIIPLAAGLKESLTVANSAMAFLEARYLRSQEGIGFAWRVQTGSASFYEEAAPYLREWEKLVDNNILTKDMYVTDKKAAIEQFATGKAAMLVAGPEDYNLIKEMAGDKNFACMGFPGDTLDEQILIGGCDYGFAVNRNAANKEAALYVVNELATIDGQQAIWNDRKGSYSYYNGYAFENPIEFEKIDEIQAQNNIYLPQSMWGIHGNEIIDVLGKSLQQVICGQLSLDEAMQYVDEMVKDILQS